MKVQEASELRIQLEGRLEIIERAAAAWSLAAVSLEGPTWAADFAWQSLAAPDPELDGAIAELERKLREQTEPPPEAEVLARLDSARSRAAAAAFVLLTQLEASLPAGVSSAAPAEVLALLKNEAPTLAVVLKPYKGSTDEESYTSGYLGLTAVVCLLLLLAGEAAAAAFAGVVMLVIGAVVAHRAARPATVEVTQGSVRIRSGLRSTTILIKKLAAVRSERQSDGWALAFTLIDDSTEWVRSFDHEPKEFIELVRSRKSSVKDLTVPGDSSLRIVEQAVADWEQLGRNLSGSGWENASFVSLTDKTAEVAAAIADLSNRGLGAKLIRRLDAAHVKVERLAQKRLLSIGVNDLGSSSLLGRLATLALALPFDEMVLVSAKERAPTPQVLTAVMVIGLIAALACSVFLGPVVGFIATMLPFVAVVLRTRALRHLPRWVQIAVRPCRVLISRTAIRFIEGAQAHTISCSKVRYVRRHRTGQTPSLDLLDENETFVMSHRFGEDPAPLLEALARHGITEVGSQGPT